MNFSLYKILCQKCKLITASRVIYCMVLFWYVCNIVRGSTDVAKDVLCFTKAATMRQWWVILRACPNQIKSLRTLWAIYAYIFHGWVFYVYFPRTVMSFAIHILSLFSRFCRCDRFSLVYTQQQCPSHGALLYLRVSTTYVIVALKIAMSI